MIAVVGHACAGKTTALSSLEIQNYKILYADNFVSNLYQSNSAFLSKALKVLPATCFENNELSKVKIKAELKNNNLILKELESLVFEFLYEHLLKHKYDFVEIANFHKCEKKLVGLFSKIIVVETQKEIRQKLCQLKGVDNYWFNWFNNQNAFNWSEKETFCQIPVVNILINNLEELNNLPNKIVEYYYT
ncbi:hypothetical protein [Mycoplasma buteonis]|uniref:hypothetical protein n=1 Tax=Mycoplasma buteonis TaxID=171280 RepID=UPI000565061C|nr:hypothetical protein [Mycoplasma buteonis]